MSGARLPARGPPGSCPGAGRSPRPSRTGRRSSRCGERSAAGSRVPPASRRDRRPRSDDSPVRRSTGASSQSRAGTRGERQVGRAARRTDRSARESGPRSRRSSSGRSYRPPVSAACFWAVGRCGPLQQVPVAEQHPPQGADDGVDHQRRLVAEEDRDRGRHGSSRRVGRRPATASQLRPVMPAGARRTRAGTSHAKGGRRNDRRGERASTAGLPGPAERRARPADRPPGARAKSERRRLSSIFHSPSGVRPVAAQNPGQQLPVAAGPAVGSRGRGGVGRGMVLDHLHVGDQPCACVVTFEQVVAEDGVLRDPSGQGGGEGIDVVDALAGEGALPEQVLVDVGDGERVGVQPLQGGVDPLEEGRVLLARAARG